MEGIAPGSILQRMYLKHRLKQMAPRTFCEIGAGSGILSRLLLRRGLAGVGFDLNTAVCQSNRERNGDFIAAGKYAVHAGDFFAFPIEQRFDLIVSSMVIEHLDDSDLQRYFSVCKRLLSPGGSIVVFVPSSMQHWGIEDETAGHLRRFEFQDMKVLAETHGLAIRDLCGLTYPVSNVILGLSNRLIRKKDAYKKTLPAREQTILSGDRKISFKTDFPPILRIVLNEYVLYPFYILQRCFKSDPASLVIYAEYFVAEAGETCRAPDSADVKESL